MATLQGQVKVACNMCLQFNYLNIVGDPCQAGRLDHMNIDLTDERNAAFTAWFDRHVTPWHGPAMNVRSLPQT